MKICVVIPTLNEQENIADVISRLLRNKQINKIIIVDDGSRDGTQEIVKKIAVWNSRLQLISRSGGKSFAKSYAEGFERALREKADVIVQMDADGSHDPSALPGMFEAISENDLVVGSRYVEGGEIRKWGAVRRLISRCGNIYAKFLLGLPINDLTSGFNVWRSTVLGKIDLNDLDIDGYAFQVWLKWKASNMDIRIKEMPVVFVERKKGKAKFRISIIFEAMRSILRIKMGKYSSAERNVCYEEDIAEFIGERSSEKVGLGRETDF